MLAALSCMLASSDDEIILAAIVCGGLIAVVGIGFRTIRKVREAGYNARLKQLMIERGMSAHEIEQVIRSRPDADDCRGIFARMGGGRL